MFQTETGQTFYTECQSVPSKSGEQIRWHDAWAPIIPKQNEHETLVYAWGIVREIASWLKKNRLEQNFRIIIGWDESVRRSQGQIFKIWESAEELDFILLSANHDDYMASRCKPRALLRGWQKDVFTKEKGA